MEISYGNNSDIDTFTFTRKTTVAEIIRAYITKVLKDNDITKYRLLYFAEGIDRAIYPNNNTTLGTFYHLLDPKFVKIRMTPEAEIAEYKSICKRYCVAEQRSCQNKAYA